MRSELQRSPSITDVLYAAGTALATILTIVLAIGPWRNLDTEHQTLTLVIQAFALLAAGIAYRRITRVRRRCEEVRLARCWTLIGGVGIASAFFAPAMPVAAIGLVATVLLSLRAHALARAYTRKIGLALLGAAPIIAFAFGVSTFAAIIPTPRSPDLPENHAPRTDVYWLSAVLATARGYFPLTYEQLCPHLPDPLRIGHGLGELFAHDGAVQAGCGTSPLPIGGQNAGWMSIGYCGRSIRSAAVVASGRPVLLYGEPARAVIRDAEEVTRVEATGVAGGDVVLVSMAAGTNAYVRAIPSAAPGTGNARRCGEVNEVADPYIRLPPAMTDLWAQAIHLHGWLWPVAVNSDTWIFIRAGAQVASGACDASSCSLTSRDRILRSGGTRFVSLADLGR